MSDDSNLSRRRFLKATSGAASTIAIAGCGGDGGGDTPTETAADTPTQTTMDTPTETAGDTPTETATPSGPAVDLDEYPYGANQTLIGEAQRVMEEAGYGPDNQYDLSWLQYSSPTWKEMANTIRSRLESAHINMSISSATFASLLNQTKAGKHEAYTLGWIADYPGVKNFHQLIDPPNTIYGRGGNPNGARLFFSEQAKADPEVRQFMIEQFNQIQNNPQNTEEARRARYDAAIGMEEGMWASACMIPVYHSLSETMWYDYVDYQPYGGMGGSRAKTSTSVQSINQGNRVDLIGSTFNTLDPIASGNTASGSVIMDVFDAPMNYVNGTTEVEGLLVEDYSVSEDLTTYSFKLKEGVQFQDGWGEVTADDVVYSIRRLVESQHSANRYFPITVMGIVHDTKEVPDNDDKNSKPQTKIVPGSTGVRKTGKYTFEVELQKPFGYAVPVLAYGAFSIVPENIVGDIQGYEGEMPYSQFSTHPVGAGPFTFVNWEPGNGGEVIVDTYQDYHGEVPSFNGVDRAIITGTTAAFNYFLNKNADIGGVPTSQYDPEKVTVNKTIEGGRMIGTYGPMENGETVNYAGVPTIDTYYIGFNMEKVPAAVRKAMAYVINHEQFVNSVFKGRGEPAFHIAPPQVFPGGASAYDKHWQSGAPLDDRWE